MNKSLFILVACLVAILLTWRFYSPPLPQQWQSHEAALIASLSLSALPPLPPDPSNQYGDSEAAAALGQRLYFDTRLSGDGSVSCASCHKPELFFTDGLPLAVAAGIGQRHTPSLVGLAHSPWFYWDGRKDSQWSQALAPLESDIEHNTDRLAIVRLLVEDLHYRQAYSEVFGAIPNVSDTDRVFANVGKAIAAYQRKLQPGRSRFDDYADSLADSPDITGGGQLNQEELKGLALFIGKAQCVSCHNGPLFTNHEFHNTGILALNNQLPSMGRYDGIREARNDPFNCLGEFSDADESACIELRFARDDNTLVGAHKTPTLRNVAETAPYMHTGQQQSLREVLEHYNEAPVSMLSHNEAKPLGLREVELRQLEAFLLTLTAPLATDPRWLAAPNP